MEKNPRVVALDLWWPDRFIGRFEYKHGYASLHWDFGSVHQLCSFRAHQGPHWSSHLDLGITINYHVWHVVLPPQQYHGYHICHRIPSIICIHHSSTEITHQPRLFRKRHLPSLPPPLRNPPSFIPECRIRGLPQWTVLGYNRASSSMVCWLIFGFSSVAYWWSDSGRYLSGENYPEQQAKGSVSQRILCQIRHWTG